MRLADFDWAYFTRHTVVPLATLGIAVLALAGSYWFLSLQEEDFSRISVDQDLMNADYDALIVRKRLVDRYHLRYERFQTHGFIGEESRLDWIETLRVAAEDLKLPTLTYALEPQRKVVPPVPSTSVDFDIQIFLSTLDLEVGLIHEEDLLDLFAELQATAPGLIKVDRCSLDRQSEQESLQSVDPNIVARCTLNMYSIVTSDVGFAEASL